MKRIAALSSWLRSHAWEPLCETLRNWYDDSAPRWSAAIAFYTIFSLAPVLVVSTAIAGFFWSDQSVRGRIVGWFEELLGARGAAQIESLIERSLPEHTGILASALGVGLLLFGASVVLATVRRALNAIWGVEEAAPGGFWGILRGRLLALGLLLTLALLLLVSLSASTLVEGWGQALEARLPVPLPLVRLGDLLVSIALLGLLFAMVFKWLSDAVVAWRDAWVGAAITSLLFVLGKFAIGLYLGNTGLASAYGAAGSVVLLLLWVYYSAMIFLLGAEATQVFARRVGKTIRPAEGPGSGDGPEEASPEPGLRR